MSLIKRNQEKRKNNKKLFKKIKKQVEGITLIALVVTVIVLLILAGVAVNLTVGNNGLFRRAENAADIYDEASDIEKINLAIAAAQIDNNGSTVLKEDIEIALLEDGTKSIVVDNEDGTKNIILIDSKKIYKINLDGSVEDTNSDFDSIYVAPDSQDEAINEGVIGIGTDGKTVDMDLWEYSILDDGTYSLNDNDSSNGHGYRGSINSNGSINGKIPQYISVDNGKNYKPVTSLYQCMALNTDLKVATEIPTTVSNIRDMFYGCTSLIEISKLPNNITNMQGTFSGCTSLETIPNLPIKLKNFSYTFQNCTSIKSIPEIPSGVTNMCGAFWKCTALVTIPNFPSELNDMSYTFYGCTSLETVPIIPEKVTNMRETFYDCVNLITVEIIPKSVENLIYTFVNCANLSGKIEINANIEDPSKASGMFIGATTESGIKLKVSGSCPVLKRIVAGPSNPNITL